jgi:hypothetical protein
MTPADDRYAVALSANLVSGAKRRASTSGGVVFTALQHILTVFDVFWLCERRIASVMIEKFARSRGGVRSEFLDLNHTSKSMFPVSLLLPKFAPDASIEIKRTSESRH